MTDAYFSGYCNSCVHMHGGCNIASSDPLVDETYIEENLWAGFYDGGVKYYANFGTCARYQLDPTKLINEVE